jgi:hypothetical protein
MAPAFALLTVDRLIRHSLTGTLLAVLVLLLGTPVRADEAKVALDACLGIAAP